MLLDLFTYEHINDVLKSTFKCSKSEFLFSAEKYNYNENFTILNIDSDGIKKKYILMEIHKKLQGEQQQPLNNSKVQYPVFIMEDYNKLPYGAFETPHDLKRFTSPKRNDTEDLKSILKDLAEHQALNLTSGDKAENSSEYKLKDLTDEIISLDYFRDLDISAMNETIDDLKLTFKKLFNDPNLLVGSIACPLAENVYINQNENKSIFLNPCSEKKVPPAYDALLYIFALSDEKFRQEHFENLIIYYFEALKTFLEQLQNSIAEKINRRYWEHQVKVLLPVVKFEITHLLLSFEKSQKLQEILTNIRFYLKYPLINQEDIYEIVRNKVESVDYNLLDYNLKSLSEKNGHLGEYFHLDIQSNFQGKNMELHLFAKFIRTSTELMKEIVENGPARKEDFFYQTLIPLYRKYKLDNLLDFAPKCYLSRVGWLLVLDDLSRQNYVGLKPNVPLNYEGLKVNIKNLANFHACSIILEEILSKESGKIYRLDEDFGEFFEETVFIYEEGNHLKQFFDSTLETYYYIFDKFPEVTKKLNLSYEEIKAIIKRLFMSVFSKLKKSGTIRNVVNHGDMYVGNMLFKFSEDKIITNGKLIDFQILRYMSPTYDLLFFLFVSSTKETRNKYLATLIEDYYEFLSENLRKFHVDPEVLLPRKSFNENIKSMKSVAVFMAFNYSQMTHINPDFREEIVHDQEKSDYYLCHHREELVDLSWDSDHRRCY